MVNAVTVEQVQFVAVEDPYNVRLVGEQIRANQRAAQVAQDNAGLTSEVQALRQELQALRQAIVGGQAAPAPISPAAPVPQPPEPREPAAPPLPEPPPVATPVATPAPTAEAPDVNSKWVWDLLTTRCASCHNTAKAKGAFSLFAGSEGNWSHRALTAGDLTMIDQVLYNNEMPKPPHPKLDAAEYNRWRGFMQSKTTLLRDEARKSIPAVQ